MFMGLVPWRGCQLKAISGRRYRVSTRECRSIPEVYSRVVSLPAGLDPLGRNSPAYGCRFWLTYFICREKSRRELSRWFKIESLGEVVSSGLAVWDVPAGLGIIMAGGFWCRELLGGSTRGADSWLRKLTPMTSNARAAAASPLSEIGEKPMIRGVDS